MNVLTIALFAISLPVQANDNIRSDCVLAKKLKTEVEAININCTETIALKESLLQTHAPLLQSPAAFLWVMVTPHFKDCQATERESFTRLAVRSASNGKMRFQSAFMSTIDQFRAFASLSAASSFPKSE